MVGVYQIVRQGNWVLKYLSSTHPVAKQIRHQLRKKKQYNYFCHVIQSSCQQKHLGKHIVSGRLLGRKGDYASPWIEGLTLQEIQSIRHWSTLDSDGTYRKRILTAIHQLQQSIRHAHKENKYIRGDWTLHNIIFREKDSRLINIDLEGFYTYRQDGPACLLSWNPKEHHVPTILKTLRTLRQQLLESDDYAKTLGKKTFPYSKERR